ncbi:hypothetical protein ES319_D06G118900v1 [Gossypium barbadense]|uniref:Protein POLAR LOCALIZATION DURING ASYMMETRIC DIVISION AND REDISTRIBUTION n=1 Tax=Gossypium barbadense TaxID=3634 RepID=A0A5J5R282_GOSBA|nr:hypothetical protein ES319_D06G118900v1 [Gossypium barbadense]PPD89682.1 hypothetical protein GOBAR_DD13383 [Gossypium barbadense]
MDGCSGLNCSAPRRIAARPFSALKRRKVKGRVNLGQRKEDDDDVAPPNHVTRRPDSSSERSVREANYNVVIGCFLLRLVAVTEKELQKMAELRIQIAAVLENVKDELRNKDLFITAKEIESNNGIDEDLESEFNGDLISNKEIFDQPLKCEDVPKEEKYLDGMDRLEAELEAELERLQLHLDASKLSSTHPQSTGNSSARSYSMSYGEVIDPTIYGEEEECAQLHCGVPPHELERKLHELLESRQEEQIRELEAALASAQQELVDKEREISWWKDTARLMSIHVQQPSQFGS